MGTPPRADEHPHALAAGRSPLARWTTPLRRLSVGKKLLLIYLLDLVTVIFISSVLIHEKYIAIDFSSKELDGTAYIDALRPTLIDLLPRGEPRGTGPEALDRLAAAETAHGPGLRTEALAARFADRLEALRQARDAAGGEARRVEALATGSELLTRIGNQSNLILDPDLDSYYTMSLVLLRYPALLDIVAQVSPRLRQANGGLGIGEAERTRLYVLEGELEGVNKAMASDLSEALAAAGDGVLAATLAPAQARLAEASVRFLDAARRIASGMHVPPSEVDAAERALVQALDGTWQVGCAELTRLIAARVHDLYMRMWTHLGASLGLLMVILAAVFYVARQISQPLQQLWRVVDTVRRTGDHTLRARWDSDDEIGRLVVGFNDMLAQLDEHRQRQQELVATARAAAAQQQLLEQMPVPLMVTSVPDHRVLHANGPAGQWLGGLRTDPWAVALDGATRRRFFQELADRGSVNEFEVRWRDAAAESGHAWAVLSARRLDYQGQDAVVTAFAPINRLKALEQRLELWAKVFEASSEGIVLLDADGSVVSANRAFCRAGVLDPAELLQRELDCVRLDGVPVPRAAAVRQTAASRGWWRGELAVHRRDGSSYPAWAVVTAIRDATGQLTHYILSCLDITERKAREEQVRYLAHHDVLTALPNRSVAEERLRAAMERCRELGDRAAVLFIDLDRFKTINDSLGHQVGDALLQQVAARLGAAVREGDTVSRFGGDEFVVLLDRVSGRDEAAAIAQRLRLGLREPFRIDTQELNVSCSIGLAMCPDDAVEMDQLMRHADAAMYAAKSAGRDGVRHFTDDLEERAQRRLRLDLLLRNAIAREEFHLVYQPQVAAEDGRLLAVEALLRWRTAELGDVPPGQFIPVAEESRLILDIGAWVLDEACRQMAAWCAEGSVVGRIAVNLSAVQLLDPGFMPMLRGALARHAVEPGRLELELTESTLIDSRGEGFERLRELQALGVGLAIDDFGTGYSSLSYLSRLPTAKVKIDRSLVGGLLTEAKDRAITEAIVALAHRLRMTVVAEGVESDEVLAVLRAVRCDGAQGWHTGRPMAPEALARWTAARSAPRPALRASAGPVEALQSI